MTVDSRGSANLDAMALAVNYASGMRTQLITQLGLRSKTKGNYIDFGAGNGDYACEIAQSTRNSISCIEPAPLTPCRDTELVKHSKTLAGLTASAAAGAYSLNVFEHIQNDAQVLRELAEKVKPGGLVFILVPAHVKLWTNMDDAVGHVRRYSSGSLRELGASAGLELVADGWFDRTGYLATRALQLLTFLKIRSSNWDGHVSHRDVAAFDGVFKFMEPVLSYLPFLPGKNRWILLQVTH